ncbi:hypothetical protein BVC71_00865 [Marivivens niveibacter]|uniref:DUF2927 domain-containing protein n=1 Tax=Marivivens niveibacter TaxID=1930667 RepID=A0A251X0L0_9RHOB|nr:DUF2927 domain-containing protein [Marivivens niveibacter]OUD10101.1 hypothetical protein BVC71_00865 [Marivivens niveibacter]
MTIGWRSVLLGLAAVSLTACDLFPPAPDDVPAPEARPNELVLPEPKPAEVSDYSRMLEQRYARLQQDLLVQGLMRTNGGGIEAPFDADDLVRNFVQIALFDEYSAQSGRLRAQQTESSLRRWEQPVRMSVKFGASVGADRRVTDRNYIRAYGSRLSRLTGVPITYSHDDANFHVLILNHDDLRASAPLLRSIMPGVEETSIDYAVNLPRDQLCLVIGTFGPDGVRYRRAVAIIRAEHPDLMRQSCVHEELAQGMGLANDSPRARPSIFNDDEEYAYLTTHDELLLKILYDDRLSVGMTADQATPIVRQIANELLGGSS